MSEPKSELAPASGSEAPVISRWRLKTKGKWGQWIQTRHNSRQAVERSMALATLDPDIEAFEREDVPGDSP